MRNYKVERLERGESFVTSEKGDSMIPFIKSGQDHKLSPILLKDVKAKDIVFCKVKGNYYTHLVQATDPIKGILITNAKGRVNGWTKQVFGKVVEVF